MEAGISDGGPMSAGLAEVAGASARGSWSRCSSALLTAGRAIGPLDGRRTGLGWGCLQPLRIEAEPLVRLHPLGRCRCI
jgi:hypothetical protein